MILHLFYVFGFTFMFLFVLFFYLFLMCLMIDVCWIVWFKFGMLVCSEMGFMIIVDWISCCFISFVFLISSCVFFYCVDYMEHDKTVGRFIILVCLFILSMLLVICSGNLIGILLGWDGLGLVSYCLVIYYQNIRSINAGMITVLSNRIGDIALLMAICFMFSFGNWQFPFYVMDIFPSSNLVFIFIMISVMTKSAQFPFCAWLPAAMAAPTPVSALVHSSTLVTAGVFLYIRFVSWYNIFYLSNFLLLVSVTTMLLSGLCALFEKDVKKVVALSTLSQLGFMMIILSVGDWLIAYSHLLTHALFKSLLFLCVGYMIHCYNGEQDMRALGGMGAPPMVYSSMNISLFTLSGLPFLSGFYTKDLIIEMLWEGGWGYYYMVFIYMGVILTMLYSLRLGYYVIWSDSLYISSSTYSKSSNMYLSMSILAYSSIIAGSALMWLLFPTPSFTMLCEQLKILGIVSLLIGVILFFVNINLNNIPIVSNMYVWYLSNMWFLVNLSGNLMCSVLDNDNEFMNSCWTESIGGKGMSLGISFVMIVIQLMWNNSIKIVLFSMVLWFFVFSH